MNDKKNVTCRMNSNNEQISLLNLIPIQNTKWCTNDQQLVILLKPKFTNRWLVKHLLPRLKSPNYKISLDTIGSFVWNSIDGEKKVDQIAEELKHQFGDSVEPVYERVGLFINSLKRSQFIEFKKWM
jgi:hypothetical protein